MSEFWNASGNRNTDAAQQQIAVLQSALDGPLPLRAVSVAASAVIDANARCVRYVGNSASDVLTLPTANALGAGVGQLVAVVNTSAVAISVVPSGNDTLNRVTTAYSLAAGGAVVFVADAQGAWWAPVLPSVPVIDVQVFTATGTWTKPARARVVDVFVRGAPGGSGSGRYENSVLAGGGGGGSGGSSPAASRRYLAAALSATVTATIGAPGLSGASQTTPNTDGLPGAAGGATSFLTGLAAELKCTGGGGGLGGTGGAGGAGGAAGAATGAEARCVAAGVAGVAGGAPSGVGAAGAAGAASTDLLLAAAGVGGGGAGGQNGTPHAGGVGGAGSVTATPQPAGGTAGTGAAGDGAAGSSTDANPGGGGGGGGGWSGAAAFPGGRGVNGASGGGGAGTFGVASGAGGQSVGGGIVVVVTYGPAT